MGNLLQFFRQNKNFSVPLIILFGPAIWSIGLILFKLSPFGLCIEFESGKIPYQAQEYVIQQVIEKTLAKDYKWLTGIGDEKTAQELIAFQPEISESYTIHNYREDYYDTGTGYHYHIRFDGNRRELYLLLFGAWSGCPDFNVTEQEIYQHVELKHAAMWSY